VIGEPNVVADGAARPFESDGVCEFPLQLAAATGVAVSDSTTRIAARARKSRLMIGRNG
jgi:hypothetical protein